MIINETAVLYARVSTQVKKRVEAYARRNGFSLAKGAEKLLEAGIKADMAARKAKRRKSDVA